MQKDDFVYVGHMADTAQRALRLAAGKERIDFDNDEALQLALTFLIQTIGEAAHLVRADFRDRHPQIPWRQIVGMRNRLVHDYLHVDLDIVWNVVSKNLVPLFDQLQLLLNEAEE